MQGSRRTTGAPRRGTCEAPPIRHGSCRDTFPSGEGAGLRALGRGSPTVAPLRPCLRAPPWLREAATSCGGRRRLLRLLRPCTGAENCSIPDLFLHASRQAASSPPVRQAHHLARNEGGPPVPPGRQRTTGITPQGVPSRPREEAISLAQHEVPPPSQARRGPGAAMVLSRFGCHRSPFGSFPREGKNAPHARATGKGTPRLARGKVHLSAPRAKAPPPPLPTAQENIFSLSPLSHAASWLFLHPWNQ